MSASSETESALQSILKNSAVLITLTTALLYFHGRAFYSGYLSYWGLSLDLFPLTTEKALIQGVSVYINLGFENFRYFVWGLLYVGFIYLLTFFLLFNGPRQIVQNWFQKHDDKSNQSPHKKWVASVVDFVFKMSVFSGILLLFVLVTAKASKYGEAWAEKNHQSLLSGKQDSKPFDKAIVTYRDSSDRMVVIEGFFLNASASYVAFYTTGEVLLLPQDRIASIRLPEYGQGT